MFSSSNLFAKESDEMNETETQQFDMLSFFTQYVLWGKCQEQTSDCGHLSIFTERLHLDTKVNQQWDSAFTEKDQHWTVSRASSWR